MEEIIVKQEAITTYVNLLKEKFGTNLGLLIKELLSDSTSMHFEVPEVWTEEEFAKWAKMDLRWNAAEEGGIVEVDSEFAKAIFESNLMLSGIEDYFI